MPETNKVAMVGSSAHISKLKELTERCLNVEALYRHQLGQARHPRHGGAGNTNRSTVLVDVALAIL